MTWHPDMPDEFKNQIVMGDARELAERIPDESIDLIFTDPVYQNIEDYAWLAEIAARVLKPDRTCLAFVGHLYTIYAACTMLPFLLPGPVLEHYVGNSAGRLFSHSVQCNVLPCLWFIKGKPRNQWMAVQESSTTKGIRGHIWGKAEAMVHYRISRFTRSDEIVLDPFIGGGVVPAVCKMLGRNYIAFEIDSETADLARVRVANTQPPLFVPQPIQEEMGI